MAYINYGPDQGRLCVVVDVLNNRRALVDGPSTGVPRQQIPFARLSLTEFVIPLKRNQKSSNVAKIFDSEGIQQKWEESTAGKRQFARLRRAELTDFDRFKLMVNKKKKSQLVKQELEKVQS